MHTMQLGTICRNTCICGCHVTPRIWWCSPVASYFDLKKLDR
jgi:hypothetical protein